MESFEVRERDITMNDLEEYEENALTYAGQMAGEYLESINKTDLTTLTPQEWEIFIKCVGVNFLTKRAELMPVPF